MITLAMDTKIYLKHYLWTIGLLILTILSSGCAVKGKEKLLISVNPSGIVITGDTGMTSFTTEPSGLVIQWSISTTQGGSIDPQTGVYDPPHSQDMLDAPDQITITAQEQSGLTGEAVVYLTPFNKNKRLTTHYSTTDLAGVDTYSSGQKGIALFKDASGNIRIYAVWADTSSPDGVSRIFFTMSPDGGNTFCMPVAVSPEGGDLQRSPAITVDGNGNVYIVWEDKRDGDYDIYGTSYDGSSCNTSTWEWDVNPFTNIVQINREIDLGRTSTKDKSPSIGIDASGKIYITWDRGENYTDIYMTTTVDFSVFTTPVSIIKQGRHSSIAIDSSNNVFITWEDLTDFPLAGPTGIKICRITNNSCDINNTVYITQASTYPYTTSRQHRNSSIIMGPNDWIYVAWAREDIHNPGFSQEIISSYDIDLAVLDGTGSSLTLKKIYPSIPDKDPGIYGGEAHPAISGDNTYIYMAWEDERNGFLSRDIYFTRGEVDPNGQLTFSTNHIVNDTLTMTREKPAIAGLDGKAYVIWTDYRNVSSSSSSSSSSGSLNPGDVYFAAQQ